MRSETTIESFKEYPTIASRAASTERSNVRLNKENIPRMINTSCTKAAMAP